MRIVADHYWMDQQQANEHRTCRLFYHRDKSLVGMTHRLARQLLQQSAPAQLRV